jgi:hypothetical protein
LSCRAKNFHQNKTMTNRILRDRTQLTSLSGKFYKSTLMKNRRTTLTAATPL